MLRPTLVSIALLATLTTACGDDTPSQTSGAGGASSSSTSAGGSTTSSSGGGASSSSTGGSGGGSVDPFSTDKTKFFGDSRCGDLSVLLCEDFEAASIDSGVWSVLGAQPTLDTTRAARGAQSAHFHANQNGFSRLQETVTFPAPNNTYWGRMFVWIDAVPIAPDWAHWTLVGADGPDVPGEIRVGGQFNPQSNKNLFGVGTDGGATGDWTRLDDDPSGNALPVPVQDWVCIEWMHDGNNDETRFFWDAVEHPSLYTSATDHGGNQNADYLLPTFDSVWIGWWLYQSGPNPDHYDVWIDEVAIDGSRIGCVL